MKYLLSVAFSVFYTFAISQNLVPNPGFDINNGCPNQIGQIDKADGWSVWGGTPDCFHSCSNASFPIYGVPVNSRGFQIPKSGDAYVGLFTFSSLNANFREYVGRALASPLVIGQTYFVSFYINHADVNVLAHSTDKIGIKFSTVPYSLVNPDTALDNAHVFLTTVVSDTANWVFVSGSFVADSAYTHFGIGNYFSDASTTIVLGTSTSNYAYYLIDDVCVSNDQKQCDISSGTSDFLNEQKLAVYPNPSNGLFYVQSPKDISGVMSVFDVTGKKLMEQEIHLRENENVKLDLSALAGGMYFVKCIGENWMFMEKLIIR